MTIILFDTPQSRKSFYPFTLTRAVCNIRYGILTIKEKWEHQTGLPVAALTEDYLQQPVDNHDVYLYIDATINPTKELVDSVMALAIDSSITYNGQPIAIKSKTLLPYPVVVEKKFEQIPVSTIDAIEFSWQLFQTNEQAIRSDFKLVTKDRACQPIDNSNVVFGKENIFIEQGATVRACIINAEEGPVYIGKNALVMEGTMIRGPVAICNNAVVKMGSKLYAGTTIGPYCTAGGEIKNSILIGYSNKAHDGYLGDSVIGEWCNLGAGTSNSNIKNTAGTVKMWSGAENNYVEVGTKAGLFMGDYSRTAINTSFNTGTVVGTCCNIFTNGFPPKHIPSFSWGNEKYDIEKAVADLSRWMKLKGKELSESEEKTIKHLYSL